MALQIMLFDEAGEPFAAGLGVELLRDRAVVATAVTEADGIVRFAVEPGQGPYRVRMQVTDEMATPREGPSR